MNQKQIISLFQNFNMIKEVKIGQVFLVLYKKLIHSKDFCLMQQQDKKFTSTSQNQIQIYMCFNTTYQIGVFLTNIHQIQDILLKVLNVFENLSDTLKILIEPSQDLINTESGQEETATVPTNNDFNRNYKGISGNIKSYKNTPVTYYINKSYFLYDKIEQKFRKRNI